MPSWVEESRRVVELFVSAPGGGRIMLAAAKRDGIFFSQHIGSFFTEAVFVAPVFVESVDVVCDAVSCFPGP